MMLLSLAGKCSLARLMLFLRSFHTLPNPMRIRVSLSDLQERKSSLVVSYLNPPLANSLYNVLVSMLL